MNVKIIKNSHQLTVGDLSCGDIFSAGGTVYMVIDPNNSNYTHINKSLNGDFRTRTSVICLSNRSDRAMYGELAIERLVDKVLGKLVVES